MQVTSSPTCKEVDIAKYQESVWYQLGSHSHVVDSCSEFNPTTSNVRPNCRFLSTDRPIVANKLEKRYNTAVFASTTTNSYDYIVVTEDFLTPDAIFNSSLSRSPYYYVEQDVLDYMHSAALNGSAEIDCMAKYANVFTSDARNVLLVTTDTTPNNTILEA